MINPTLYCIFCLIISFVATGCTSVPIIVGALDPGRYLANEEARDLCKKDGGLHVFDRVGLIDGRFPTIVLDDKPSYRPKTGTIYGKYRYEESSSSQKSHGYYILRKRVAITSMDDGKLLGELVYYIRQGEPGLPGITCPEHPSVEDLMNSVFSRDGEQTSPYPSCDVGTPSKFSLAVVAPPVLTSDSVTITKDKFRRFQQGIGCDERTKIDPWYGKTGENTVGLVGTRLLFFRKDGHRCQAMGHRYADRVICESNAIYVLGRNGNQYLIQKFEYSGKQVAETEIDVPHGVLASYREDGSSVKLKIAQFPHGDKKGKCFEVVAKKALINNTIERIGPEDRSFGYADCTLD